MLREKKSTIWDENVYVVDLSLDMYVIVEEDGSRGSESRDYPVQPTRLLGYT